MLRATLALRITYAFLAAGLATSAYLLFRTLRLLEDWSPEAIDPCSAVFGASCDPTLLSPISWALGVPLAGWGTIYFAVLAALLLLGRVLDAPASRGAVSAALAVNLAGAIASLLLSTLLLLGVTSLCPLCLVVHVANLGLLAALLRASGRGVAEHAATLGGGLRYLGGARLEDAPRAHMRAAAFAAVALLAVVLYQWILVQVERRSFEGGEAEAARTIAAYGSGPRYEIPVESDDGVLGPEDAPVRLVVFSSFRCPGCRVLARELPELLADYPRQLRLVYKHFPISRECNPAVRRADDRPACEAARLAVAAARQGRYWQAHDALFAADLSDEAAWERVAARAGLDPERYAGERSDSTTARAIRADGALGARLGVDATPTAFLNGRRVPRLGIPTLRLLVEHLLAASGR